MRRGLFSSASSAAVARLMVAEALAISARSCSVMASRSSRRRLGSGRIGSEAGRAFGGSRSLKGRPLKVWSGCIGGTWRSLLTFWRGLATTKLCERLKRVVTPITYRDKHPSWAPHHMPLGIWWALQTAKQGQNLISGCSWQLDRQRTSVICLFAADGTLT